jgi:hypothetical protein
LDLEGGGTASIVAIDGERVVLSSSVSSPPGSTLRGRLTGDEASIAVKVRSCRRRPDDATVYTIEGRFVNLSRAQRERLSG